MSPITLGILAASGAATPGSYELITSTVLTSTASSVTFSSLGTSAAAYKHLQLRMVVRSTSSGNVSLRFNSDTGANYAFHRLTGDSSFTVASYGLSSRTFINMPEATTTTNIFAPIVTDILDFSNSNKNKTIRALGGNMDTGTQRINFYSGAWFSTAAITSLTLSDFTSGSSFTAGSRFSLYGIKG